MNDSNFYVSLFTIVALSVLLFVGWASLKREGSALRLQFGELRSDVTHLQIHEQALSAGATSTLQQAACLAVQGAAWQMPGVCVLPDLYSKRFLDLENRLKALEAANIKLPTSAMSPAEPTTTKTPASGWEITASNGLYDCFDISGAVECKKDQTGSRVFCQSGTKTFVRKQMNNKKTHIKSLYECI